MNEKRVSVVMPVYNGEPFLRDALNDLLSQSYFNIELICIDDGSKDKSLDVLNYYSENDKRVLVEKQSNKGAGEARNKGLNMASGEYIIFLDCDDRYTPDYIKELVQKACETDADITICGGKIFDGRTGELRDNSWILNTNYLCKDVFSPIEIKNRIFNFTSGMPWNKLYKTSFVKKQNIVFQNTKYWNDTYFAFILLAVASKVAIIPHELVYYRTNRFGALTNVSKGENPIVGLELLVSIKDELIRRGIYSVYEKSYVNFVLEKILFVIQNINEKNYENVINTVDINFLNNFGIENLQQTDFTRDEYFEFYVCLKKHGTMAAIIQVLSKFVKDSEWNYNQLYSLKNNDEDEFLYLKNASIKKNSKIIICGMGSRGMELLKKINASQIYEIVACLDKNFDKINAHSQLNVKAYEEIIGLSYDFVIISVDDLNVMKDIKRNLIELGVESNKIIW